jgi:RNA polymerase sigma factor (sigma-70 family)
MIHSTAGPDAPLEDAAVLQASGREPERFAEIFHRYFAEIHGYVARRLGADLADDIAAETFLAAFRKREKFDPARGSVRPWLYGMATNPVGSHQRAQTRYFAALARTPSLGAVEDHGELVADQLLASSHRPALAAARAELQATDREVLLLIALADFSYREVAEALGIPEGTVASRLNRARTKLRAALGGIS